MLSVSCWFENIPTALTLKVVTQRPKPRKLFSTSARRDALPRVPKIPSKSDSPNSALFNLDLRAGRFDLFLDLFGFRFGHAFLDRLGSAFDERLGFGQTESRHRAPHFLDHADLVRAHLLQDDFKSGLLFRRRWSRARTR